MLIEVCCIALSVSGSSGSDWVLPDSSLKARMIRHSALSWLRDVARDGVSPEGAWRWQGGACCETDAPHHNGGSMVSRKNAIILRLLAGRSLSTLWKTSGYLLVDFNVQRGPENNIRPAEKLKCGLSTLLLSWGVPQKGCLARPAECHSRWIAHRALCRLAKKMDESEHIISQLWGQFGGCQDVRHQSWVVGN